ncbi:hypothetical protein Ocin01_00407 [Orchesella cincta]|uniref:Uncharacterized protein n=1 Tax=Orchesella cincta TaxID=48709 RepID=A0A1D2NM47_ORCCI|nr:hypothetical protein Ocin01_00407 [Orchesella cincta]
MKEPDAIMYQACVRQMSLNAGIIRVYRGALFATVVLTVLTGQMKMAVEENHVDQTNSAVTEEAAVFL